MEETEEQVKGPMAANGQLGVERCVLNARSAILKQKIHLKDSGPEGMQTFDEYFLEVFELDAFVVLQALPLLHLQLTPITNTQSAPARAQSRKV